jgi:hypothetical protein
VKQAKISRENEKPLNGTAGIMESGGAVEGLNGKEAVGNGRDKSAERPPLKTSVPSAELLQTLTIL